jgi:hypothetical protein
MQELSNFEDAKIYDDLAVEHITWHGGRQIQNDSK